MPTAYYDGNFVEKHQIKIDPADYGFARGVTLFEFTRVYGGVPFRLEDHVQRFERGAETLGIPLPVNPGEIVKAAKRLASENKYAHSGIKFYLTIGECGKSGDYGFKNCTDFTSHLMIIEDEFHPAHPEAPRGGLDLYRRGISLKTVPFIRQIAEAKTINYAAGFLACRQLGPDHDEILYLHPDGYVTETTTSNIFCVIDGALCTPLRDRLQGVTAAVMLELAEKLKIPVNETDLTLADLRRASEAFITGSFVEMQPVRLIDDIPYAATMDAPIFAKLRQAFTACIAASCKGK